MSRQADVEGHFELPGERSRSTTRVPRIGSRLRAARRRRGLDVTDAERVLRVRARHLEALEAERFDALPGEAYARAFLREYADYLGLDGEQLVHALDERLGAPDVLEPEEAEPEIADTSLWVYADRLAGALPVRLLAGILAMVLLGLLAWWLAREPEPPSVVGLATQSSPALPSEQRIRIPAPPLASRPAPARPAPPNLARLVLTPNAGDVWLLVRDRSEDGPVLYEGTLHPGGSLRFARRQLWIRIGAPWNLVVRLNGRIVHALPTRPGNVLVTPTGVRAA